MEYIFSSSNHATMLLPSTDESNRENLDSNHEDDAPFFGQFSSPFLDEILHHNHQQITTTTAKEQPAKTKRVRKQRSAGKKDRHSKIHTAQGLRDRRMRLSLQIARKFFGLQDMLGFDKASKTIEWLFSKSKKAIDELNESVRSQNTTQNVCKENIESCESPLSDCDVDSGIEFDTGSNKGKESKNTHEFLEYGNSRTRTTADLLARESRNKARARARERTRERMLINNPKKHTQLFGENPNDDFDQLQLGFSANPNSHYIEEQSRSPNEYSGTGTYHFFDHTQLKTIAQETQDYMGNVVTATASSSNYLPGFGNKINFANLPAGLLNSSNTFLGFLGDGDTENFIENYGLLPNRAPYTGDHIHGQNSGSVFIPPNLLHFYTQNQRD